MRVFMRARAARGGACSDSARRCPDPSLAFAPARVRSIIEDVVRVDSFYLSVRARVHVCARVSSAALARSPDRTAHVRGRRF